MERTFVCYSLALCLTRCTPFKSGSKELEFELKVNNAQHWNERNVNGEGVMYRESERERGTRESTIKLYQIGILNYFNFEC